VREGHEIGHTVKDHLLAKKPRILDAVIHLEPARA
jgi:divalent metal cation (Fe/Co/Zn/Cd) transporter